MPGRADEKRIIRSTTFDSAEGIQLVPILTPSRPAVTKSPDGKIWFLNGSTVSFIDPSRMAINTLPPPVHIEQVVADGQTFDDTRPLGLPPRIRNLQINYTALSMVAPEKVHFRYMLEGQDSEWREVVNKREVQYSNLSPGTYRFRVAASNNSGLWNGWRCARLSVAPAHTRRTGFGHSARSSSLALLWAFYQLRVRQLHHRFDMMLDASASAPVRGSCTTRCFRASTVCCCGSRPRRTCCRNARRGEGQTGYAIEHAAKAITEGRDAVQGLRRRPSNATISRSRSGLLATSSPPTRAPPAAHIQCRSRGSDARSAPDRDEIYKIAAEALRNAFRVRMPGGSRSTSATTTSNSDCACATMGRDRRSGARKPGARGTLRLRGMPERAALIGGKLAVWSEVGAGTEVELRFPPASSTRRRDGALVVTAVDFQDWRHSEGTRHERGQLAHSILTVDDHPVVRDGIAGLVGVQPI